MPKESLSIGIIGQLDHGKTTLAAAILAVQAQIKFAEAKEVSDIASEMSVDFESQTRHHTIYDYPDHANLVENLKTGQHHFDVAILVVSIPDGLMSQAKEQVRILADLEKIPSLVVFLNKEDLVDGDGDLDLVREEVRDLLIDCGLDGTKMLDIPGSALAALQNPEDEDKSGCITALISAIDDFEIKKK